MTAGHLFLIPASLGGVFRSPVLRRLELTQPLAIEAKTPPEVVKLLGWSEADARTPGAYPAAK